MAMRLHLIQSISPFNVNRDNAIPKKPA